jgi:lysophospholipase
MTDRRHIPDDALLQNVAMDDGWPVRVFDRPQTNHAARGSILFQGGRGDIIEKYLEPLAIWHAAGWHVTAFDWRGQGGSGRLGSNPHVGHVSDFAVWIDDLAAFYVAWVAKTPGPHVVMGHSMGGHLILRALMERKIAPDAAVLIAPMLGFDTTPLPFAWAARFASHMARKTAVGSPAWKRNEKPGLPWLSRQNLLTHDNARYDDELWWKAAKPELELGPPSWQWMDAAYRSVAAMDVAGALESVSTPLLMIGTDGDRLVSPSAIRRAAARISGATLKMFDKRVAHEILREADAPRNEALAVISDFLDKAAPVD